MIGAQVVHLRDYSPKPKDRAPVPETGAVVMIMPVVRGETYERRVELPCDCESDPA